MVFKVQDHWETYTKKVDHMVEEALRSNIKHSMKKLSRAINGDNKTSPNPLFKVLVALRPAAPNTTPKVPQQALFFPSGHVIVICLHYCMSTYVQIC